MFEIEQSKLIQNCKSVQSKPLWRNVMCDGWSILCWSWDSWELDTASDTCTTSNEVTRIKVFFKEHMAGNYHQILYIVCLVSSMFFYWLESRWSWDDTFWRVYRIPLLGIFVNLKCPPPRLQINNNSITGNILVRVISVSSRHIFPTMRNKRE